jgi:multidrug efflux pump subunit AcrB
MKDSNSSSGIAGYLARGFINSRLTLLFIFGAILLGVGALLLLPREEEPQIKVPMVDVLVSMPGFSAKEVEERATRPMEKLLWEIPGVEYVYSTSRPSESLVVVRFKVGEDVERSLVKLNQKLQSNFDKIPPGVSFPLIKVRSIDDVPILALTFHSARYDHLTLRRLVAQVDDAVKQVPLVAETNIIGGAQRQIRVLLDPQKLASHGLSPSNVSQMLRLANREFSAGSVTVKNGEMLIESGGFLSGVEEVESLVVGSSEGKPIFLREVAEVRDEGGELNQYVFSGSKNQPAEPAVTLTVAKRPGTNAISISEDVLKKITLLKGEIIPSDVTVTVTRNYGETAAEKSNELLLHMGIAIVGVTLLIWWALGLRESLVVATAIPTTLALTLLTFFLFDFTLNRITLFALIFSIGILVDDAIVVVENIVRHLRLANPQGKTLAVRAIEAVSEVGNPTILATFAVIAAVLPMAFVGGMMGPYMRPIPIGASAAMIFSLLVAFIVTPWAALRLLKHEDKSENDVDAEEDKMTKFYRWFMHRLLTSRRARFEFLGGITLLLLLSMGLVGLGWVKVKMLPFDNKSEFQVIINMPEGSSLEQTAMVTREIATKIATEPEVRDYQLYIGTAAPFNFNGLVRHYFLRHGASSADIQVNLVSKSERSLQSHQIVKRIRPAVQQIAKKYQARVALTEVPPGPPVLQTLVAEVYGEDDTERLKLATKVKQIMQDVEGIVDVDWYVESEREKYRFAVDKNKAALHGISAETISEALRLGVGSAVVDILHSPREKEDVNIVLELPRAKRSDINDLLSLRIRSGDANSLTEPGSIKNAPLVPLGELVRVEHLPADRSIYHKNLHPITYVLADVAGAIESPVYALSLLNEELAKLDPRDYGGKEQNLKTYNIDLPFSDLEPSIKWDGEWHITLEVFRDLGLAFVVVLILIYALMVGWFESFLVPLVVMAAIPFSLVGILPAHGALGAFFSAPSMIGFMAGAGIVVRNSIILVDFIQLRLAEGMPLEAAVVDAGAVRFRPMMLTAMAVVVGASVLLADPIFQGLAISLMAGEIASLLISRMAVPVLYFMLESKLGVQ